MKLKVLGTAFLLDTDNDELPFEPWPDFDAVEFGLCQCGIDPVGWYDGEPICEVCWQLLDAEFEKIKKCVECGNMPNDCSCDSCPICNQLNPIDDRSKCGCDICKITGLDDFDQAYSFLQEN